MRKCRALQDALDDMAGGRDDTGPATAAVEPLPPPPMTENKDVAALLFFAQGRLHAALVLLGMC